MSGIKYYKKVLSQGVVVLLVASVLSHWAVSGAILQQLAQTDQARVKTLLGYDEWLDAHGLFAIPLRERWTWGALLAVLIVTKLVTATRLGTADFPSDVICALLGTFLGAFLAFAGHILTYNIELVFRRGIIHAGVLGATVGLGGALLLSGLAKWLNAESKTRNVD